ncbi:ATP phosphoribosyltransferase [Priestia taiwanensis]|uniref:ATP phosphoribosyltransferase n=1 Tax=Priestia taiwanensis TaxID=1347902 RepID=A0A917AL12_9BACI|nr:ATP phosphoribosyltransferase [Priestia taiwanensis]MBM7361698.1 ATP phosphoribosyltransferase [Priestia taiwanensis]GGE56307.1 ATP phosphoribosyltransferase [Priestia taiwanensis]
MERIQIALTKGRLLDETISIFEKVGIDCSELRQQGRKLIFQSNTYNISFILVKAADVLTYVEHGVADIGVVGNDLLLENEKECYEMLDLNIGRCKFCVASIDSYEQNTSRRKTIATKYPTVASTYFRQKGEEVDIIKIEGSVEIAPLLGLADAVVDIVETGRTLRENGLVVLEEMYDISARLIVNKASLKMKKEATFRIIDSIEKYVSTKV